MRHLTPSIDLPHLPAADPPKCRECNDTDWCNANGPGIRVDSKGQPFARLCVVCQNLRSYERAKSKLDKQAGEPPI